MVLAIHNQMAYEIDHRVKITWIPVDKVGLLHFRQFGDPSFAPPPWSENGDRVPIIAIVVRLGDLPRYGGK